MTPISGACFIPVHLEEFTGVLFRCFLFCLTDLCFFPSTVIKSYKQREGAIAAGTKRAASGLGTDFRDHGLPLYINWPIRRIRRVRVGFAVMPWICRIRRTSFAMRRRDRHEVRDTRLETQISIIAKCGTKAL